MATDRPDLLLASSSRYRRSLLERICDTFETVTPAVDEQPLPGEAPAALAARLARAKADACLRSGGDYIVIGSDQVAALGDRILGKPGNAAAAAEQLAASSGREVVFHTAVCVLRPATGFADTHTDVTRVQFRRLSAAEIAAYLDRDKPWDCAGSFRSEGHGVTLFEAIHNQDPTALIGLPLIWLAASLRRAGLPL